MRTKKLRFADLNLTRFKLKRRAFKKFAANRGNFCTTKIQHAYLGVCFGLENRDRVSHDVNGISLLNQRRFQGLLYQDIRGAITAHHLFCQLVRIQWPSTWPFLRPRGIAK